MILNILYLLCYIIIIKVSDSQQNTIPLQALPIYQRIPYNSNIPVSIPPSNNNNHYPQTNTAQNVIPDDLAKLIIGKVLSSPSVHKYLNSNTKYCQKNGCSTGNVPHVTNNYFIVPPEYLKLNDTEVATDKIAPKLFKRVENDIVVIPTKTIKTESNNKQSETLIESKKENTKEQKNNSRKTVKNKPILADRKNNDRESNTITINGQSEITCSKSKDIVSEDNAKAKSDSENKPHKKKTRKRRRKKKKIKKSNEDKTENTSGNHKTELSSNTNNLMDTEHNKDTEKSTNRKVTKPVYHMLQIISDKNPLSIDNENNKDNSISNNNNRFAINPKDDTIIRDFRHKFPEVPENIARTMLAYVQSQFQNNFANNLFCPGIVPFGFDNLFKVPQMSNNGQIYKRRRKNKARKQKRKQKNRKGSNTRRKNTEQKSKISENSGITIEPDTSIVEVEKVATKMQSLIQIDETPIDSIEIFSAEVDLPIELDDSSNNRKKNTESLENVSSIEEIDPNYNIDVTCTSEIDENDFVPAIQDNRLIDDYYPIFTDDPRTFDSDSEFIENLNNRYYYTTDKNPDDILYDKNTKPVYEEPKNFRQTFKETLPKLLKYELNELKHTYFDVDREGFKNLAKDIPKPLPLLKPRQSKTETIKKQELKAENRKEETGFKSPPALEFPDFVTRKVEKPSKLECLDSFEDVDEEVNASNSEDSKNSVNFVNVNRDTPNEIETIYAKSKVVKYGAGREDSVANSSDDSNEEALSYVIAKSLMYSDETW